MKRILATGGLGFVGSHTCLSLLYQGYKIIVIDSLINSSFEIYQKLKKINEVLNLELNNKFTFIKGDIRNSALIENIFQEASMKDQPINSVIHFAGLKSVNQSILNPLQYWDSNVIGTINLLKTMRNNQCFNIVFSSSATVYKPKLNRMLDENSDLGPMNPYGMTKLTNEKILEDIFKSDPNKWSISLLRYFNPVGAHSSGSLGELPIGMPNNLFPILMKVALGELDFLSIYGKDWPTKDGTCIRDFIHVMDLAEAHIAALKFLIDNRPQNIALNIGTGKGTSVLEIIKTFQEVNGICFPYHFVKRRMGDQPFLVADNKLALSLLDWIPTRNIVDMCADSVKNLI